MYLGGRHQHSERSPPNTPKQKSISKILGTWRMCNSTTSVTNAFVFHNLLSRDQGRTCVKDMWVTESLYGWVPRIYIIEHWMLEQHTHLLALADLFFKRSKNIYFFCGAGCRLPVAADAGCGLPVASCRLPVGLPAPVAGGRWPSLDA